MMEGDLSPFLSRDMINTTKVLSQEPTQEGQRNHGLQFRLLSSLYLL